MAYLLYRASTNPTTPESTSAKGAALTNLEVDGNFKSINNELALKAPLASPTFTGNVVVNSTTALKVPVGTEAQRPTGATGLIRYNSTLGTFEGYRSSAWGPIGGGATGGGTDDAFYENTTVITTNYTITTGKNAMTAGPVTINSGIEVTVPSGSVWTIV